MQIKSEQQKKSGDIKAKEGELANAKSQLEPLQVSFMSVTPTMPMRCSALLCHSCLPWHTPAALQCAVGCHLPQLCCCAGSVQLGQASAAKELAMSASEIDTDAIVLNCVQRKLEALRASVRGEEKRVSELEQKAHTTSNAADIAQVTHRL